MVGEKGPEPLWERAGLEYVEYQLDDALPVLRRTPAVLRELLVDARPMDRRDRGPAREPFDVVGHLIRRAH
jgi:hypothetical protein